MPSYILEIANCSEGYNVSIIVNISISFGEKMIDSHDAPWAISLANKKREKDQKFLQDSCRER